MNKPIKAKNLPLFSIIDLDQLRREKHLEGTEVTDFFTARDMFTAPITVSVFLSTLAASMANTLSAPFAPHSTASRPKLF